MKYTFLLVNYNMGRLVTRLAANIQQQIEEGAAYEIIIADNSSDPSSRLDSQSLPAGVAVHLLEAPDCPSFTAALNRIMPLASGDYVAIMHPDVELRPGCLAALRDFLDRNPRAGIVAPDLCYPNGSPNRIRMRFPAITTELRRLVNIASRILLRRNVIRDEILWDRSADAEVDMVMSVCMLIRRAVLTRVQNIDGRLKVWYSNDYICARARQFGWTCHYVLAAKAIHFERYTPPDLYSGQMFMEYKRSPIAANPNMRADYYTFIGIFYPAWKALALRLIAICEDCIEVAAQLKQPRKRANNIRNLWRSIAVGFGRNL